MGGLFFGNFGSKIRTGRGLVSKLWFKNTDVERPFSRLINPPSHARAVLKPDAPTFSYPASLALVVFQ